MSKHPGPIIVQDDGSLALEPELAKAVMRCWERLKKDGDPLVSLIDQLLKEHEVHP